MRRGEMPGLRAIGLGAIAAIVAAVMTPVALFASTAAGLTVLAVVPVLAAVVVAGVAVARPRGRNSSRIAALAAGAAPALGLAAASFLERALIAGPTEPSATRAGALVVAIVGAVAAIVVTQLVEITSDVQLARAMVPWSAGLAIVIATGWAAVAWLERPAPSPESALSEMRADVVLAPMPHDVDAQTASVSGIEVDRRCESMCRVRLKIPLERREPLVVAHAVGPTLGRGAVAVLRVGRALVLAPVEGTRLRSGAARAFDASTGVATSLRPRELGGRLAAPRAWRIGASIGLALALACLGLALAARRRRARIAGGVEAEAEAGGLVRMPDGETIRADRELAPGPVVVLDRRRAPTSYRDEAVGRAREVVAGTRARALRALDERVLGCELAALAAIALTHAPMAAAWLMGRVG